MVIKRIIVALVLGIAIFATSYPLLHVGFFRVHDYTHAARISEMSRALVDGHFPVRWSPNLGFGYGMPLFNFYAPLPYYVGSALYLSGFSIIDTIKLLYFLSNVLTIVGTYKMARLYFGRSGALLAAVLVGLAPYRALNLYIRGALSETYGLAFIPWIIYSAVLLLRGFKRQLLLFTLATASLALSHNISLLLSTPIIGMFLGFEWLHQFIVSKKIHLNRVGWLAWGSFIALLLAAFYVVPAIVEKNASKLDSYILDYYFTYQLHFLYIRQFFNHHWQYGGSGWGPNDDVSFGLGYGQLAAVFISGILIGVTTIKKIRVHFLNIFNYRWFWIAIASGIGMLFSLLMTLEKTLFIWQSLSFLKYAQFPWRWLTIAVPMLALFGGVCSSLIRSNRLRYLIVLALISLTIAVNFTYFKPNKYLDNPLDLYVVEPRSIRGGMSSILPDYIPKAIPKNPISAVDLIANTTELGDAKITIINDKVQAKLISVSSKDQLAINWALADFPGWVLEVDGKKIPKKVSAVGTLISDVPPGEHLVGAVLTTTSVQYWSQIASILGLLLLLATTSFSASISQSLNAKK